MVTRQSSEIMAISPSAHTPLSKYDRIAAPNVRFRKVKPHPSAMTQSGLGDTIELLNFPCCLLEGAHNIFSRNHTNQLTIGADDREAAAPEAYHQL